MAKNGVITATAPGCRWIDVEDPDERMLAKLQRTYGFSKMNIDDILSPTQRPKLDLHDEYAFFVFRFPSVGRTGKARATELDVVMTHDTVITFHGSDLHVVRSLVSDARLFKKRKEDLLAKGPSHVLFEVLRMLFDRVYTISDDLAKRTDSIEGQIFDERVDRNQTISRIAQLRRRLLDYGKIAKPQPVFLQYCVGNASRFIPHTEHHAWRSLIDTAESQRELFEATLDVLNGLAQSHDALTTNRFNRTVRTLTIISVVFLPASFVLSILSNDTPGSPLHEAEGGFVITLFVLIAVQTLFLWLLRRRRII